MDKLNKFLTVIFIIALMFLILTFSIGLPIYCRFFYYAQIEPLGIEEYSGFTREQIIEAYDDVLDYCTRGKPFSTGELLYNENEVSHFSDCRKLFNLNLSVLIISFVTVAALTVLDKTKVVRLARFRGLPPSFYSAAVGLGFYAVIFGLSSINFYSAFIIFHNILFPGKTDFYFDPDTEQIILILPNEFFLNCAILIISSITLISLALIIYGIVKRKKDFKKADKDASADIVLQ